MATSEYFFINEIRCAGETNAMFARGDKACVDALGHDSSLPCRVQFVRLQEEQAEDGAGRKNGSRTKSEEEKAKI